MNSDETKNGLFDEPEVDSEELFEAFVDAPYGVYCVNLAGNILFCNLTAAQILECAEHELLNKVCSQILGPSLEGAPSYRHLGCAAIPWALKGDIAPSSTCNVTTLMGRQKWLTVTHMLLPSDKPALSLIVHILYDITDQVEGKMLLQRLGSYLSAIDARPAPLNMANLEPRVESRPVLTGREMDVLHLLSQGKGTKDIATGLVISEATVRTHIQHLLDKLSSSSRLEAVAAATRLGLV